MWFSCMFKRAFIPLNRFVNCFIIIIFIIIIIIIIALQPFGGPWPLFQFLEPTHNR
jgi:hypothetical protein